MTTEPKVIGNRVFYAKAGMQLTTVDAGVVRENRIRHSGDRRGDSSAFDTTDTRFVRNLVRGGAGYGILLASTTSGNVLRDNDARNNAGDRLPR